MNADALDSDAKRIPTDIASPLPSAVAEPPLSVAEPVEATSRNSVTDARPSVTELVEVTRTASGH